MRLVVKFISSGNWRLALLCQLVWVKYRPSGLVKYTSECASRDHEAISQQTEGPDPAWLWRALARGLWPGWNEKERRKKSAWMTSHCVCAVLLLLLPSPVYIRHQFLHLITQNQISDSARSTQDLKLAVCLWSLLFFSFIFLDKAVTGPHSPAHRRPWWTLLPLVLHDDLFLLVLFLWNLWPVQSSSYCLSAWSRGGQVLYMIASFPRADVPED